jgi:nucleoside-diphosphate kinase
VAVERTFAIIKPHVVVDGNSGDVISLIERNGFDIVGMRKMHISQELAQQFYNVHNQKPFFGELVGNIAASPVIVMALERDGAIGAWRDLMGATNPDAAAIGTLRAMFGKNISFNATHGSDAPETASYELGLFFADL